MGDVHVLVEAEQRRLPGLLLQAVGVTSGTPADGSFGKIARIPQAVTSDNRVPRLSRVRVNVVKTVPSMLSAGERVEGSHVNVADGPVRVSNVLDDQ